MQHAVVVGIAGGSGSGKSTLVDEILAHSVASSVCVLRHDAYYIDRDRLPEALRVSDNWDHPDALENALFCSHLDRLKQGQAVDQPVYDFGTHSRTSQTCCVDPRPIILCEGILLLAIPEIRDRIDIGIFVDTPGEERIMRRMIRDTRERGRTLECVAKQFRTSVRPMHDVYVEPSRRHAHLIIPWDWQVNSTPAIRMVLAALQGLLTQAADHDD